MSHIYHNTIFYPPAVALTAGDKLAEIAEGQTRQRLAHHEPGAVVTRARVTLSASRTKQGAVVANVRLTLPGKGYKCVTGPNTAATCVNGAEPAALP